jgi:hypothetical protein
LFNRLKINEMKKYVISLSIIAAVCFYVKSVRYEYTGNLVSENIEALSRMVSGLESVNIGGVTYHPQYVDKFDETGKSEDYGPSHFLEPEDYGYSPVPKPGGGFYTQCADNVCVKLLEYDRVCYGRL